jgi:hypothetical protein
MNDDKRNLDAGPPDETAAAGPLPAPIPDGGALTDPGMASFGATDASTGGGLGDILKETFVRSTLSPEENALTRDHHVGHEITGRLDEAVDAPDHSVTREEAELPARGR